jgi:hypothetical protein
MTKKIALSLVAALTLVFSYGLAYWSGFSHAPKGARVIIKRDTGDSQQPSGKAGYEPYFTKQNLVSGSMK